MQKKKKKYIPPTITVVSVEMEDQFSASSFRIRTGGAGNEPKIEDWDTKTDGKFKDFDL